MGTFHGVNPLITIPCRYRNFSTRVLSNYATTFLTTYSAGSPHRDIYRLKRNLVNVGFSYQPPEIPAALDSLTIFRTLCGSSSEKNVKFGLSTTAGRRPACPRPACGSKFSQIASPQSGT